MQEKTYTSSDTRFTTKSKKCGLYGLYDDFTVRFASPHSREKNRPELNYRETTFRFYRILIWKPKEKSLILSRKTIKHDRLLTFPNACFDIQGRLADGTSEKAVVLLNGMQSIPVHYFGSTPKAY